MGWLGQDGMRDSPMNALNATVQDRPAASRHAEGLALEQPQGTFGSGATLWFTGLPSAGKSIDGCVCSAQPHAASDARNDNFITNFITTSFLFSGQRSAVSYQPDRNKSVWLIADG